MNGDAFLGLCREGRLDEIDAALARDPSLASYRAGSGETPLMTALYRGHHQVITRLVAAGAALDLFAAAALGPDDVLRQRIAAAGSLDVRSYDGWTALHLAAFFGRDAAVAALLAAGSPVSPVSANAMRNTPLHAALAGGHEAVALRLVEAGADVSAPDAGRHTPLHIAAENGLTAAVRALMARGADPLAVDADDQTPLSRAAARNHAAVVDAINDPRPAAGDAASRSRPGLDE